MWRLASYRVALIVVLSFRLYQILLENEMLFLVVYIFGQQETNESHALLGP